MRISSRWVSVAVRSRAGLPQKDIGAVVGLHNSVFETGFDEEGGAVKLPHAAQEIEVGERG